MVDEFAQNRFDARSGDIHLIERLHGGETRHRSGLARWFHILAAHGSVPSPSSASPSEPRKRAKSSVSRKSR